MPPGIKRIYEDLSYLDAWGLAKDLGMPVEHVPSGTTYWPSGYIQVPPLRMPKGQKRSRTGSFVGRKGGGFAVTGLPSDASLLAAVKIAEGKIKKAVGFELGGMTTGLNQQPVIDTLDSNDSMIILNGIAAGNGEWQRRGNKVTLKNVRITGVVTQFARAAAVSKNMKGNVFRMLIVWDKSPNGIMPKISDVLGGTDYAGTESTFFWSHKRFDNTNRFQILRDITVALNPTLDPTAGTGSMETSAYIDEFIKLGDRVTQYSSVLGNAVASISSGGLYAIMRADENETDVTHMEFLGQSRIRYSP